MFSIDKYTHKIRLTRGDTATIYLTVKKIDGTDYEIQTTDTITMTVKNTAGTVILTKTADSDHYITIAHSDTSALSIATYLYDVQLTTTDGYYYTIIPQSYFELTDEVSI